MRSPWQEGPAGGVVGLPSDLALSPINGIYSRIIESQLATPTKQALSGRFADQQSVQLIKKVMELVELTAGPDGRQGVEMTGQLRAPIDDDAIAVSNQDPVLKIAMESTACLVERWRIKEIDGKWVEIESVPLFKAITKVYICESEPFFSDPACGYGSGVAVGPDLLLTAGHNLDVTDIGMSYVVFGLRFPAKGKSIRVPRDQVFKATVIDRKVTDEGPDWAILRLKHAFDEGANVDLVYAKLSDTDNYPDRTKVLLAGHPSGLPLIIDEGGWISPGTPHHLYIWADTMPGNSGSPVFHRDSGKLCGVYLGSISDLSNYQLIKKQDCFVQMNYPTPDGHTGIVQSLNDVRDTINTALGH